MRSYLGFALTAGLLAAAWSSDALACGACFTGPPVQGSDNATIVRSHRMALSMSPDQTILWDQIQYSGSPSEFAWVLPIKPGARVEVGSEAWFDALEAATSTSVNPPRLLCKNPNALCSINPGSVAGGSFGCSASAASEGGPGAMSPPVQVVSDQAAGPYEAVILKSDVPGALPTWLTSHGYEIPPDISPIIDAYVAEGFDFAALRLLPAAGVQQMQPVRVVQPGAVPTLPLRMVAAGTGDHTAITLFVIAEGRYTTENFPEVTFPRDLVLWDFDQQSSTYSILRDQQLGKGHAFLSPYAEPGALFGVVQNPSTQAATTYTTTKGWAYQTIADAFVEQAFINGETSSTHCMDNFEGLEEESRRVVMPQCDASGKCAGVDAASEIDARTLTCDAPIGSARALDDLAQAMIGMHPRDVWVTRLEGDLARDALKDDLVLTAAPKQEAVTGPFSAQLAVNLPASCKMDPLSTPTVTQAGLGAHGSSTPDSRESNINRYASAIVLAMLGFLLILRRSVPRLPHGAWKRRLLGMVVGLMGGAR